jgi:hypothetical protein
MARAIAPTKSRNRRGVSSGGMALQIAVLNVVAGTKTTPQLKDGKAKLIVEATSNDLLGKTARLERDVTVVTQPPTVSVDSEQHYLYLGMADLATFNVGRIAWTEAGVRVGDQTFAAWPMPGGKPGAFFALRFCMEYARGHDSALSCDQSRGERRDQRRWSFQFPKKEQPKYTAFMICRSSDRFMQKVTASLDPNGSGDPVARFVKINTEMRRRIIKRCLTLRLKTADKFLWSRTFRCGSIIRRWSRVLPMCGTISTTGRRSISRSTWATIWRSRSMWAWRLRTMGALIYAAPLGIYGNCIVLDHGYGCRRSTAT